MAIIETETMNDAELRVEDMDNAEATEEGAPVQLQPPVRSLRPVDDRGGPTSIYQGDIDQIVQVAVIYENLVNGRDPTEGLKLDEIKAEDLAVQPSEEPQVQ
jgi:hypothetical protein